MFTDTNNAIKKLKKYFPVIKRSSVIDTDIAVFRGENKLWLTILGDTIYFNNIEIDVEKLSENFNTIVSAEKAVNNSIEKLNFSFDKYIKDVVGDKDA